MGRLTQLMASLNNRMADMQTKQEEQGRTLEAHGQQCTALSDTIHQNALANIVERIHDKAEQILQACRRLHTERDCLNLLTGDNDRVLAAIMRINVGVLESQVMGLEGDLQRLRGNAQETARQTTQ